MPRAPLCEENVPPSWLAELHVPISIGRCSNCGGCRARWVGWNFLYCPSCRDRQLNEETEAVLAFLETLPEIRSPLCP